MAAASLRSCMPCEVPLALVFTRRHRSTRSSVTPKVTVIDLDSPVHRAEVVDSNAFGGCGQSTISSSFVGLASFDSQLDSARSGSVCQLASSSRPMVSQGIISQSFTELAVEREALRQRVDPDELNQQISLDVFGLPGVQSFSSLLGHREGSERTPTSEVRLETPICTSPATLAEPHSDRAWCRQPTTPLDERAENVDPLVTIIDPAASEDQQPRTKSEFQEALEHLGFRFPDVADTALDAPPSGGNPTLLTAGRKSKKMGKVDGAATDIDKAVVTQRNEPMLLEAEVDISEGFNAERMQWLKGISSVDACPRLTSDLFDMATPGFASNGTRMSSKSLCTSSTVVNNVSLSDKALEIAGLATKIAGRWTCEAVRETGGLLAETSKVASAHALRSLVEVGKQVDAGMSSYADTLREALARDEEDSDGEPSPHVSAHSGDDRDITQPAQLHRPGCDHAFVIRQVSHPPSPQLALAPKAAVPRQNLAAFAPRAVSFNAVPAGGDVRVANSFAVGGQQLLPRVQAVPAPLLPYAQTFSVSGIGGHQIMRPLAAARVPSCTS